jgi:hypothetical protein
MNLSGKCDFWLFKKASTDLVCVRAAAGAVAAGAEEGFVIRCSALLPKETIFEQAREPNPDF